MPIDHNRGKNPLDPNPIILIPARMASTRLPNKPMAMIGDAPMIVHCWRRAQEAKLARVVVACDAPEIAQAVQSAGGEAVLTEAGLPSGSDRIWQALQAVDPSGEHQVIVNLQGDMPTLDPAVIGAVLKPLSNPQVDIATLAAEIDLEADRQNPAVVKIAMSRQDSDQAIGAAIFRALYFSRATIPHGAGLLYHHIGLYAYRRTALERFISLPPSPLEKREKLEQLRALEAGMRIDVVQVNTVPLGVDTPQQLEQARHLLAV